MRSCADALRELVELSRELGRPEHDWAILGEGNTSAACGDGTFWVKASGASLASATEASFVRVAASKVTALLDAKPPSDAQVEAGLMAARVDAAGAVRPSVETLLHAVCLAVEGVRFVGHTHPTAVNRLLCSVSWRMLARRLFPDEIVVCGPASVLVPYVDPGVPLARAVRTRLAEFVAEHKKPPRVVLLKNHGLVALGVSAGHVRDITAMAAKAAAILAGALAAGGPSFLPEKAIRRIDTRPDEHYRKKKLGIE